MKTNKKSFIYVLSSIVLVLCLCLGAFVAISCDMSNITGTVVHPTELSSLPSGVDELTVEQIKPEVEGKKAAIKTSSDYIEYDSIKEAYETANSSTYRNVDTTVIFFDNWIAEGNDGFGDYAGGWANGGYGKSGSIAPTERDGLLIINLNGYTLGRKIDEPIENGSVINIRNAGSVTFKNGYITGGNTTGDGGGIYINYVSGNSVITFDNLHIRNNYCDGNGGGIYSAYQNASIYSKDTDVYISNCSIFYNVAKNMGGGILLDMQDTYSDFAKFYLQNKVVVSNNTASASSKHNNLTIGCTEHCIARIQSIENLSNTSNIYVSLSNNTSDDTPIAPYTSDKDKLSNIKNCFHCDDSDRQINLTSSDTKHAIEIKKKSGC